jgi:hypothetical protein
LPGQEILVKERVPGSNKVQIGTNNTLAGIAWTQRPSFSPSGAGLMQEFLSFLSHLDHFGGAMVLIGFTAVVAFVAVLSDQWIKQRIFQKEAELKQQMIERGMSAEEIKEVLQVSQFSKQARKCSGASAPKETIHYKA